MMTDNLCAHFLKFNLYGYSTFIRHTVLQLYFIFMHMRPVPLEKKQKSGVLTFN